MKHNTDDESSSCEDQEQNGTTTAPTTTGDDGVEDCSRPDVTTKYRIASDIINEVLKQIVDECKEGTDIHELCKKGDLLIEQKCEKVYNKKEKGQVVRKGIAFPTCISPNELCDHFSPLAQESRKIEKGDVVKVNMGCHIDGYIAVAAHTIVVGEDTVTGRKADLLKACHYASEAALRTIVAGASNSSVTEVLNKCASEMGCNMLQGTMSFEMKRHVIEGANSIISKETAEEKVAPFTFSTYSVYGIDVIVSTGEGKPKESEIRSTVFKRDVGQSYKLKTQLGRQFFHEVNTRFPTLPFSIRSIDDEKLCRLGVSECMRHELLQPYPVLTEKAGEFVAQFKYTVMLLPGGTKRVTGLPFNEAIYVSENCIKDESIKKLLASSANPKKKKKKSKDTSEPKEAAVETN